MKKIVLSLLVISVALTACVSTPQKECKELSVESTPQEVLDFVLEGNSRFVSGEVNSIHRNKSYVGELEAGQHPSVAVVACSDSRVPVELLFDMGFGDIFVIRTAGNTIIGDISAGSVDYALNHLGVKVILFLGHTNCGAITGVVSMGEEAEHHHHVSNDEGVEHMLDMIACTIEEHRGAGAEHLMAAIEDNAVLQANTYKERAFVKELIDAKKLIVAPAIYDLATGEVKIIE